MSNVSMKARSWSFSSESDVGKTNIDPFSAVYAVQKQIREGNHVLGGKACSVLVKVANSEGMRFVTSSDVIAYLEATKITNPTEMHPFPLTKVKRCPVEANSAVNNFGPFSFLSLNINSPGLKACPDITFLNFKVPGPKLETNLQAYTFAGSKKATLEFVYEKATGKHVLSKCQGDQLQERLVLGAPVVIEDEAVTCLRSSSRWPVVGVVGLDEDLKVCPYFVSANMFADSSSGESCEGSSRSSGVAHAPSGAQECYELGLKSARQAGDRATERKAILKLGNVYSSSGEHRQAIQCYTKSLDISKEAGDLAGIKLAQECLLKSYLDLGDTQLFCGDHQQAIKFYTNSFNIAKETGDQAGVKLSQGRLRKSYLDLGDNHLLCSRSDHQQAIEFYKKSLDMEAGDLVEVKLAQERLQKSYLDLGDTHLFCGNHRQAIKFYTKSIDIAKEAGDLVGVKLAQERLRKSYLDFGDTHLFCSRGDHQQAIEFYTKSLNIAKEADDLVGVKLAQERLRKSYLDLGDTHLLCSHGDHQQAIEFYTKSLNIAKEASDLAGVKIAEERLEKCLAIPKQGERLAPGNESNATAADENFPSNHEKGQSCYKHTQAMLL